MPRTRDSCNAFEDNIKPSIGNDGRHCVCVKPHNSFDSDTAYDVTEETLKEAKAEWVAHHTEEEVETGSLSDVFELYQSDFDEGTYRIQTAGYYKIMENIEFNFNAGSGYVSLCVCVI